MSGSPVIYMLYRCAGGLRFCDEGKAILLLLHDNDVYRVHETLHRNYMADISADYPA
jgi:hypothetical protein